MKTNRLYNKECRLFRRLAHLIDCIPDFVVYSVIAVLSIFSILVSL